MKAKDKFREGWIMLLRPFKFAEISQPLQKMTVLYAYSDKPLLSYELNEKGKEEMEKLNYFSENNSIFSGHHATYSKRLNEDIDEFDERISKEQDRILSMFSTVEVYKGTIVECYVEGQLCKFFPDEYNVISKETFDHLLVCDEHEYKIDIENETYFATSTIKDRLHYIMSRGIDRDKAMKMASGEAMDNVIFRPQEAVLEMFCREHEIY